MYYQKKNKLTFLIAINQEYLEYATFLIETIKKKNLNISCYFYVIIMDFDEK